LERECSSRKAEGRRGFREGVEEMCVDGCQWKERGPKINQANAGKVSQVSPAKMVNFRTPNPRQKYPFRDEIDQMLSSGRYPRCRNAESICVKDEDGILQPD
jgi:hypothetical protein